MNNRKNDKNVINLKKSNFKLNKGFNLILNNNNLSNLFSSTKYKSNLSNEASLQTNNITIMNKNIFTPSKLKRNKTTNCFYDNNKENNKKLLTQEDKIKMNSIITKFKKYKILTKDLYYT